MNSRSLHHFSIDQLSDTELWKQFRSGDRDAFERIYHLHVKGLYSYGMTFIEDSFTVKECIQDLFVDIWSHKDRLGDTDNIKFYLMRSLRRRISKSQSDQKRWESTSSEKIKLSRLIGKKSLEQFMARSHVSEKEIAFKLSEAIGKLPVRQKETLYHIYYENLTYEQAASIMNVNVKTVYNLAWRGVETLRKSLSKSNFFYLSPILIASALEVSADIMEISQ
ncbi:RNA polymerase sigma factor [Marinoscillum sp.]|uniref:RNA polymerase sigma factor n=1 Tax=Marinoscillum sp. TaxID=2024838 RepID=UPI003BAC33B0